MAVYYIFGKDELLIREKVQECLGGAETSRHYGEEMKLEDLFELLTARDLFSLEEYHWVSGVAGIKFPDKSEKDELALTDALAACPPCKRIAFTQNTNFKDYKKGKEYERSPLHRILDEHASKTYNLTNETYPSRVTDWTRLRARDYGLLLTESGVEHLAEACAYLPQLVDNELLKLSLLKQSDKKQQVPDGFLRDHISFVPSQRVFAYIDALFERKNRAVHLLKQMLELGESGTVVLSMVYSRLRLIARAHEAGREAAVHLPEIASMYSDTKRRFLATLGGWPPARISRAMELVGETDFRLKSSPADEYDLLAIFTVEVMNL